MSKHLLEGMEEILDKVKGSMKKDSYDSISGSLTLAFGLIIGIVPFWFVYMLFDLRVNVYPFSSYFLILSLLYILIPIILWKKSESNPQLKTIAKVFIWALAIFLLAGVFLSYI